jgi:protein-disulfide isomerase
VLEALKELNISADYEMIADLSVMKEIGLEYTPAIFIDDQLISQGKYYSLDQMKTLLLEHKK